MADLKYYGKNILNHDLIIRKGDVSGSVTSTGSFGKIEATSLSGDGSLITGLGASIFSQTGSAYAATNNIQITGSLSVLGNISGSFSGLGVGQKYKHSQTVAATTWTVSHNFDYQYVNIDVYDGNDQIVIPTSITATDSNTVTLTFGSAVSGNAIISTGGQAADERGKNFIHTQSTPSVNWRVSHSIGDQYPSVTVYDDNDNVIIPQQINATDTTKMDIIFTEAVSGNVRLVIGGGIALGTITGSAQIVERLPSGTVSSSAQIASDISGSFTPASSSFSTRVTTEEANVDTLQSTLSTEQGYIDTLQSTMTSEQTNIDNLQTDSGSFSIRHTNTEATGSSLISDYSKVQSLGTNDSPTFADLTATGTVTAQEFHTQFVSASIIYKSGSTQFGDTYDDRHEFTGSLYASGSVTAKTFSGIFNGALSSSAQIASDVSGSWQGSVDISSDTNLVGGTNITLTGDTLNVDDAFIINDGNDTTSGTITAGGFTTAGTVQYGSISDGTIAVTAWADEDNMASDSATLIPTQQSVKAYVDAQVTAQDLDFQGDSGGALNIDLDSETLDIAGDGAGISTAGSGNQITISGDHDALTNFAANEHFTQANITTTGTVTAGVWNSTFGAVPNALISGSFSAASASLETNKATKGFTIAMSVAL